MPDDSPILGGDRAGRSGMEPQLSTAQTLALALDALREPDTRDAAVGLLLQIGDTAIPALLDLLHDDNMRVRQASAWTIGRIKDRRLARGLLRAVEWSYPDVQAAQEGSPHAFSNLLNALLVGRRASRVAAAVGLGRSGSMRAVPDLIEALNDEYLLARLAAMWALGQLADPAAVPHLADGLYDPDPAIQQAAAAALTRINTPPARAAVEAWQAGEHG